MYFWVWPNYMHLVHVIALRRPRHQLRFKLSKQNNRLAGSCLLDCLKSRPAWRRFYNIKFRFLSTTKMNKNSRKFDSKLQSRSRLRIFGGSSHPSLSKSVAIKCGVSLGELNVGKFANNETSFKKKYLIGNNLKELKIIYKGSWKHLLCINCSDWGDNGVVGDVIKVELLDNDVNWPNTVVKLCPICFNLLQIKK